MGCITENLCNFVFGEGGDCMLSACAGCNLHCLPFFDRIGFDEVRCCVIKSMEMESIKEIFRIGFGPSSSHTMAPRKAAELFLRDFPDAARFCEVASA